MNALKILRFLEKKILIFSNEHSFCKLIKTDFLQIFVMHLVLFVND
jgi:hypothetical protein